MSQSQNINVRKPSASSISIPELSLEDIKTFEKGIKSTNMLESKLITTNDEFSFRILEIMIHDQLTGDDIPAYSIGQYEIFGDSHIRWATYNINALYQVKRGNPTFWIGDEGKTIKIGNYICVPAGIRHCIYNNSFTVFALVDIIFPGRINLPPNK